MNPGEKASFEWAASVVIPCRNAAATLSEQLDALCGQEFEGNFEVILVDNGSTDASVEIATGYRNRFAGFKLVSATEGKGAGYARNVGVGQASAPKVLFCDADDVVSPCWVASMVDALDRHPFVGGGRDFHRLNPSWHPVLLEHPASLDPYRICDVHYAGQRRIPNVGAGNVGMWRSVYLELGGFELDIPIHEDVDLCLRAHQAGYPLALCPEAMVSIRVRHNMCAVFRQAREWGYWNVALLKKHRRLLGHPPVWRPLLSWPFLLMRVFGLRSRSDLALWTYRVGWKCGRLCGSIAMGFIAL